MKGLSNQIRGFSLTIYLVHLVSCQKEISGQVGLIRGDIKLQAQEVNRGRAFDQNALAARDNG
jgi:hypothetical protein